MAATGFKENKFVTFVGFFNCMEGGAWTCAICGLVVVVEEVVEEDNGVGVDVVGEGNGECDWCCCWCKDAGCGWGINWVFIILRGSVSKMKNEEINQNDKK